MAARRVRWALIGASQIAEFGMIAPIRAQGGEIVALQSASAERAAAFAQRQAIARWESELEPLLADAEIDAVYVSSTNEKHFPQAMAAIEAGKHVLCEKPLALRLEDARTMVEAARARGVVFATNHHLRCHDSHRAIRAAIEAGRIGEVLSLRIAHAVYLRAELQGWRIDDPAVGGGVIPDILVHDADVARFLLGEDPDSLVAIAGASGLGRGVEDSVMAAWSVPSGAMVQVHASFTHRFAPTGLEVHGARGSILAQGVLSSRPGGAVEIVDANGREPIACGGANPYEVGVAAFHAAVAGEGRPAADGWDGLRSLAVVEAALQSARTGARVAVSAL